MLRYIASFTVAAALTTAALYGYSVWVSGQSAIPSPDAQIERRASPEPWFAKFEADCDRHDPVRLAESPSSTEYAILRAAVGHILQQEGFGRVGRYVLKGQAVSLSPEALNRFKSYARLQGWPLEPSALRGLRYLSSRAADLEAAPFAPLPIAVQPPDRFHELPEGWEFGWHRWGSPLIISVSRAGIGCSLQQAVVYAEAACGNRCGMDQILELGLEDERWSVVDSQMLAVR